MAASQKLGEQMYKAQEAAGGAGAEAAAAAGAQQASSGPANDDNVVDAEVKDVKKG
jgi:molecular chaperone DnaK